MLWGQRGRCFRRRGSIVAFATSPRFQSMWLLLSARVCELMCPGPTEGAITHHHYRIWVRGLHFGLRFSNGFQIDFRLIFNGLHLSKKQFPAAPHRTAHHITADHSTSTTADHSTARHTTADHTTAHHTNPHRTTPHHTTPHHGTPRHITVAIASTSPDRRAQRADRPQHTTPYDPGPRHTCAPYFRRTVNLWAHSSVLKKLNEGSKK